MTDVTITLDDGTEEEYTMKEFLEKQQLNFIEQLEETGNAVSTSFIDEENQSITFIGHCFGLAFISQWSMSSDSLSVTAYDKSALGTLSSSLIAVENDLNNLAIPDGDTIH